MKIQYLFITLIILTSCSSKEETLSNNHYFLLDRSDSELIIPACDEVLHLIKTVDRHIGSNVYFSVINDNRFNPIHALYLKQGISSLLGNDHERSKQKELFEEQLCALLENVVGEPSPYDRSEIFRSVVGIVKQMNREEQDGRLVIYSDLLEHSDLFCSYCEDNLAELRQNLDSIVQVFCQSASIPDNLVGISIAIKHQPKPDRAEFFQLMIQVYTQIFESRGARVNYERINEFKV